MQRSTVLPSPDEALPGRRETMAVTNRHYVLNTPILPPFPPEYEEAYFAMGCFWGAERLFWEQDGVWTTAVGYAGGTTPNPTYKEVCTGRTGHAEVVRVVFDPKRIGYRDLLALFWERHDPTQGMRQHGDVGTQYRSMLLVADDTQRAAAEATRDTYASALLEQHCGEITTTIQSLDAFYYAENFHQQYLAKTPRGSCELQGTGVVCARG